ncbi:MAG: hypothetical protein RR821_07355 [Clostridia bacterium]
MKRITSFLMTLALVATMAQTAVAASSFPLQMSNPYQDTVYLLRTCILGNTHTLCMAKLSIRIKKQAIRDTDKNKHKYLIR